MEWYPRSYPTLDIHKDLRAVYDNGVLTLDEEGISQFFGLQGTEFIPGPDDKFGCEMTTDDRLAPQQVEQLTTRLREERLGRLLLLGRADPSNAPMPTEQLASLHHLGEGTTVSIIFSSQAETVDWERWHHLLDISGQRPLTSDEQAEYDRFAEVVAKQDDEEAAVAGEAIKLLVDKHQRVLASIERLTEAVRAAADRT